MANRKMYAAERFTHDAALEALVDAQEGCSERACYFFNIQPNAAQENVWSRRAAAIDWALKLLATPLPKG